LLKDRQNLSVVDGSLACLKEPESVADNSSHGLQHCLIVVQILRHSCMFVPVLWSPNLHLENNTHTI
jgi:hypothetical protein